MLYFALTDLSHLGRLDYSNMTQQALMECLVSHLDAGALQAFQDEKAQFKDISEWPFLFLDHEGVVAVDWSDLRGSIDLQWLPQTVVALQITDSWELRGTVDFRSLPESLISLKLENTSLCGEIRADGLPKIIETIELRGGSFTANLDLSQIPHSLKKLRIHQTENLKYNLQCTSRTLTDIALSDCGLSGTISFHNSPPALRKIDLSKNNLYGTLNLAGIAPTLSRLKLNKNKFSGTLDLDTLPPETYIVNIGNNAFGEIKLHGSIPPKAMKFCARAGGRSGSIDFANFPPSIKKLDIPENGLSGTVRLQPITSLIYLNASKNRFHGGLNLIGLPGELCMLDLSENNLSGSLDFSALPVELQIIMLHTNKFTGSVRFENLPQSIIKVHLAQNSLSGSVSFEALPTRIRSIDVSGNRFEMDTVVLSVYEGHLPMINLTGNTVGRVIDTKGNVVGADIVVR